MGVLPHPPYFSSVPRACSNEDWLLNNAFKGEV